MPNRLLTVNFEQWGSRFSLHKLFVCTVCLVVAEYGNVRARRRYGTVLSQISLLALASVQECTATKYNSAVLCPFWPQIIFTLIAYATLCSAPMER